jgi:hypothetical protein
MCWLEILYGLRGEKNGEDMMEAGRGEEEERERQRVRD